MSNVKYDYSDPALRKGIKYSPETGVFYRSSGKPITRKSNGYVTFYNGGYAHINAARLAFVIMGYKVPRNRFVDHINGIKTDNRWENLRLVTKADNNRNRPCHRRGHKLGTTYDKKRNKWCAQITVNGVAKNLGRYKTQDEAHNAYLDARGLL